MNGNMLEELNKVLDAVITNHTEENYNGADNCKFCYARASYKDGYYDLPHDADCVVLLAQKLQFQLYDIEPDRTVQPVPLDFVVGD